MVPKCVREGGAGCWENWTRNLRTELPDIGRIFHALGDPTRRAMVERISQGPVSVSRLADPLDMTLAAVVQHLQVLEESGLVKTEKTGRVRTCSIDPAGLSALERWFAGGRWGGG